MKQVLTLLSLMLLVLLPVAVHAAGPTIAAKGVLCWLPVPDVSLTGYKVAYTTTAAQPTTGIVDVGLVTTAPTPPPGVTPCAPGAVGVLRDNTGLPNGQMYAYASSYNIVGISQYAQAPFLLAGQVTPAPAGLDPH